MKIHFIAIGGAAMHNLALALQKQGHVVTGSDDEVYNPARDRLAAAGLLPEHTGWFADKIYAGLDVVILGMHARADNPELLQAQAMSLPVVSYPEFVYQQSMHKQRLVVVGSHGKTTTTAMVMHALRLQGIAFDYLVGAQLDGFDTMASLSDAPLLVVEGDEYLSSPIDPLPKMVHYRPHAAALTGIAWDHINVFPDMNAYFAAFGSLLPAMEPDAALYWPQGDPYFPEILSRYGSATLRTVPYEAYRATIENGVTHVLRPGTSALPLRIFGAHNLLDARAAALLCAEAGVSEEAFLQALTTFTGAGKRLQCLGAADDRAVWLDFAHAPSKVRATTQAVREQHPERRLVAGVELHTYSSLNRAFLPEYKGALDAAHEAFVFYSPHTLSMKQMPPLDEGFIRQCFGHPQLKVFTDTEAMNAWLSTQEWAGTNLLLMSSGTFGGWDAKHQAPVLLGLSEGTTLNEC
jgi:UDP-N-acetylmuramate: L-alanyl-gamma-D-glutamyl-meso-diaminopimelate ligase